MGTKDNQSTYSQQRFCNSLIEFHQNLFVKKRFAFLVFIISFSFSLFLWQSFIKIQRQILKNSLNKDLKLIEHKLSSYIENKKLNLNLLSKNLLQNAFRLEDSNQNDFGFDFIARTDENFIIKESNNYLSDLINRELALEEHEKSFINSLISNKKTVISSKAQLYQEGKELNFFVPLFSENDFKGILVASIKLKTLLDYLFKDLYETVNFEIKSQNIKSNSNEESKTQTQEESFFWSFAYETIHSELYIPISDSENLLITARPSKKTIDSLRIFPEKYILALVFLFPIFFAFTVYYVSSANLIFLQIKSLIDKLNKENLENQKLKEQLHTLTHSTTSEINNKSEALKHHKAKAYRLVQEVLKSKNEIETNSKTIFKNSQKLKLALESAGIGVWAWDIKKDELIWDEFTRKIFNINESTQVSNYQRFINKVIKEDREKLNTQINKVLNQGGTLNTSFKILDASTYEKDIALKAKVFMGADLEPSQMMGILIDQSYELNNSTLLNKFFSLPIVLFCVADLKGNFKILNSAWEDVLGFSISELKSSPFLSFVHPEDRERTQVEYQLLMGEQGYQTINFSNRYRTHSGAYKTLMWNAIKMKNDNHIYAIAWDMSVNLPELDSKDIEDERALLQLQLKEW